MEQREPEPSGVRVNKVRADGGVKLQLAKVTDKLLRRSGERAAHSVLQVLS